MESFGKKYKLCSRTKIIQLFQSGNKFHVYPYTVLWLSNSEQNTSTFQLLISVPKRQFKKAHDRNYLKRITRESVRKNKFELENKLLKSSHKLSVAVIYNSKEKESFHSVEKSLQKIFRKLNDSIADLPK